MNRKAIVSVLAIILIIAMIFSLLLSVIPMSSADGVKSASCSQVSVQTLTQIKDI